MSECLKDIGGFTSAFLIMGNIFVRFISRQLLLKEIIQKIYLVRKKKQKAGYKVYPFPSKIMKDES